MALTVEIVHGDNEQKKQALTEVYAGLSIVQAVVGPLPVVNDRRVLPLSYGTEDEPIEFTRSLYRRLARRLNKADFSLVVTNRPLGIQQKEFVVEEEKTPQEGCRITGATWVEDKIAFVRHFDEPIGATRTISAHEMGHMFEIRDLGRGHCSEANCIMFSSILTEDVVVEDDRGPVARLAQKLRVPLTRYQEQVTATDFCTDCKSELVYHAPLILGKLATSPRPPQPDL